MPDKLRELRSIHFCGIEFQILGGIRVGSCQSGDTWGRIVYLQTRSSEQHVSQMGCSTLAFGPHVQCLSALPRTVPSP